MIIDAAVWIKGQTELSKLRQLLALYSHMEKEKETIVQNAKGFQWRWRARGNEWRQELSRAAVNPGQKCFHKDKCVCIVRSNSMWENVWLVEKDSVFFLFFFFIFSNEGCALRPFCAFSVNARFWNQPPLSHNHSLVEKRFCRVLCLFHQYPKNVVHVSLRLMLQRWSCISSGLMG